MTVSEKTNYIVCKENKKKGGFEVAVNSEPKAHIKMVLYVLIDYARQLKDAGMPEDKMRQMYREMAKTVVDTVMEERYE